MNELQNTDLINIPSNPDREWIWTRILVSIDFFVLKRPTALQWALIKVLSNIDKLEKDLTTEKIAQKLAVEKSIIEEGLTNLIEEHYIVLQPRKKTDVLQNYNLVEEIDYSFKKYELITSGKSNKKILLFYDYKDERTFSYQIVEKPCDDEVEEFEPAVFELVLLALIEQIWKDLEKNPNRLAGEGEFQEVLHHKLVKDLKSILLTNISVNFL